MLESDGVELLKFSETLSETLSKPLISSGEETAQLVHNIIADKINAADLILNFFIIRSLTEKRRLQRFYISVYIVTHYAENVNKTIRKIIYRPPLAYDAK